MATVTVTLPSGAKPSGALVYADAFTVTLRHQNGWTKSFPTNAATLEVHDPVIAHQKFLATYTDKNSHDLFARLETLNHYRLKAGSWSLDILGGRGEDHLLVTGVTIERGHGLGPLVPRLA